MSREWRWDITNEGDTWVVQAGESSYAALYDIDLNLIRLVLDEETAVFNDGSFLTFPIGDNGAYSI